MTENEKKAAESLAEALNKLPADKREFLIGYAEGVAAMSAQMDRQTEER